MSLVSLSIYLFCMIYMPLEDGSIELFELPYSVYFSKKYASVDK